MEKSKIYYQINWKVIDCFMILWDFNLQLIKELDLVKDNVFILIKLLLLEI